jgi:hypothetical protein
MTTALEQPPSANNRNPELDPGDGSVETPQLPERMILPLDVGNLVKIIEDLAENSSLLTHQDKKIVEQLYIKLGEGWLKAKLDLEHILAEIRFNSSVNQAGIASFKERKKAEQNPITLRLQRAASLLLAANMLLAACTPIAADASANSPTAVNAAATLEVTAENQATATPTTPVEVEPTEISELVEDLAAQIKASLPPSQEGIEDLDSFIEQHQGTGGGAGGLDPVFAEIIRNFETSGHTWRIINAEFINLVGSLYDSVLFEIPSYTNPEESQWVAFPSPVTGSGALYLTLEGSNTLATTESTRVAKWVIQDSWPVGLNESGGVVRTITPKFDEWQTTGFGQYVYGNEVERVLNLVAQMRVDQEALAPQATATETATFAEPTMDNVEITNDWIRRWVVDQFNLPELESASDGRRRFSFNCITDEIITAKYEIGNSGIYALASAECWYEQDEQLYEVLIPLAITDLSKMVIAGYGVMDYRESFETFSAEQWSVRLAENGFIGRGHIFSPLVSSMPDYTKGTNQGFGNAQLYDTFTEEMLVQFATSNGDPSVLPTVVINGVEHHIFWSGQIGLNNHTLNNNNPYAQP